MVRAVNKRSTHTADDDDYQLTAVDALWMALIILAGVSFAVVVKVLA